MDYYVGCVGWNIPKDYAGRFPAQGSHLERYAQRFPAVEINTSFYRPHRPATYARWAASVPDGFRFAVKIPREITHSRRLREVEDLLERFLGEASTLGGKLGPLLVQLPPSLAYDERTASAFFAALRRRHAGPAACEPRHASWFASQPDRLLHEFQVARVAADPPPAPTASQPGGWAGLVYYRLHGSPRMYYSEYSLEYLDALAAELKQAAARQAVVWCIFDNTAQFAATGNALALLEKLNKVEG